MARGFPNRDKIWAKVFHSIKRLSEAGSGRGAAICRLDSVSTKYKSMDRRADLAVIPST
jgi:hypothetical protein